MLSWFLNTDVRAVCSAITKLERDLNSRPGSVRLAIPDAFRFARERALSSPNECKRLLNEFGRDDVAAYLVFHASGDLVASGDFHVYRGLLNSTGGSLKGLFHLCLSKLVESKCFTEEERLSAEKALAEDIERAG